MEELREEHGIRTDLFLKLIQLYFTGFEQVCYFTSTRNTSEMHHTNVLHSEALHQAVYRYLLCALVCVVLYVIGKHKQLLIRSKNGEAIMQCLLT